MLSLEITGKSIAVLSSFVQLGCPLCLGAISQIVSSFALDNKGEGVVLVYIISSSKNFFILFRTAMLLNFPPVAKKLCEKKCLHFFRHGGSIGPKSKQNLLRLPDDPDIGMFDRQGSKR